MEHFEDIGPSVVLASPGMMQSGLSRELFESWCTDKRNGTIIAGYCVEGTLAKVRLYYLLINEYTKYNRYSNWTVRLSITTLLTLYTEHPLVDFNQT